ncbi:hypothetical protein BJ875DRAFT_513702 [Amylocarpus encephaloides]|uniref:Uncharacterized protein n=1 Tax=Amylocarpus encephaloides TaxID=45428 RepID=A0A9P7YG05_9HELO|nr:hypothetical protein BJ875DRAFT_513702 [Amylocarpus encephaloides]
MLATNSSDEKKLVSRDHYEVESPQEFHGLHPRALQSSDSQLHRRSWKRRGWAIACYVCMLGLLLYFILLVMRMGGVSGASPSVISICSQDTGNSRYKEFVSISFLLVTDLPFSTAKSIDVAVDLILGQGGRALHAWLSYFIFSDALTRMLETVPASYELYLAAKLDPISIDSVIIFCNGLVAMKGTRQRWLMVWFFYATMFVLAFPTLFSASTGYFSPSMDAYTMPGGNIYVASSGIREFFEDSTDACYKIPNGPLIGLPPNATFVQPKQEGVERLDRYFNYNSSSRVGFHAPYPFVTGNSTNEVALWMNLSNYFFSFSAEFKNRQKTIIPLRNFSRDDVFWINGTNLGTNNALLQLEYESCWNNTVIDFQRACIQQDGYVYGLAGWIVVVLAALEIIWISGMFGIWWDANRHGELNRRGWKRSGVFRSVVEVSEALEKDLGPDTSSYTEEDLARSLKFKRIGYTMEKDADLKSLVHVGLTSSSMRNRVKLEQDVLYR